MADHDRTSNLAEASQNRSFIARFCILIQGVDKTLNKLPYAPLQYLDIEPDIHQAERLGGGLPPSVLRVSEKNSSRKGGRVTNLVVLGSSDLKPAADR